MAAYDTKPKMSISNALRQLKVGYTSIRHEDHSTSMTTYYSRLQPPSQSQPEGEQAGSGKIWN